MLNYQKVSALAGLVPRLVSLLPEFALFSRRGAPVLVRWARAERARARRRETTTASDTRQTTRVDVLRRAGIIRAVEFRNRIPSSSPGNLLSRGSYLLSEAGEFESVCGRRLTYRRASPPDANLRYV